MAARVRLRPILMTTAAMVTGLMPLLTASGAGAASRFSIGLVVVAGMSIGTLFTLFVLPAVYVVLATDHRAEASPSATRRSPSSIWAGSSSRPDRIKSGSSAGGRSGRPLPFAHCPMICSTEAPPVGASGWDAAMKRRDFLAGLGTAVLAAPRAIRAQEQARTYRLGTVNPVFAMTETSPFAQPLVAALADRGYTIGRNLVIEARGAAGDVGKIPAMLQELKARHVDALVIVGYPTALAAKPLGIPTVAALGLGDPVATGLIESLAHPGGNITGISDVASELSTKRLSLLRELLPHLSKVAMLWNKDDLGMTQRYEASAKAAQALGISVLAVGVSEPNDFNGAFALMAGERPDAILMVADSLTNLNRERVFEFAAAKRLPADLRI